MAAPMDLSILYDKNRAVLEKKVLTAFRLGYSSVAINYITHTLNILPSAKLLKVSEEKIKQLGINRELKQYTRLTLIINETTSFSRMVKPDVQSYDIIAVRPTNEKMLALAATTLDIDIISVDMTEKLDYFFMVKAVRKARLRHIYFELCYSATIRDRTLRKNVFSNALSLSSSRGAANVIVSSECETPAELRSPKDVMNLGMLFGLSETAAKDAVTLHARAVVVRAYSRNSLMKRVLRVDKIQEKGKKDTKTAAAVNPAQPQPSTAVPEPEAEITEDLAEMAEDDVDEVDLDDDDDDDDDEDDAKAGASRKRRANMENGKSKNKRSKQENGS